MGAGIIGVGSDVLVIHGTKQFHECHIKAAGDRIVAATYLMAAAACQGEVMLTEAPFVYMKSTLQVLKQMGCNVRKDGNRLILFPIRYPILFRISKQNLIRDFPRMSSHSLWRLFVFIQRECL